jgi:hypothetical protein
MRSTAEDLTLQKQQRQHVQLQHDNDLSRLRERLEASETRCSTLSQQLQQMQFHSQQIHSEDLRRANSLLQASESRGTALAQQLQVRHAAAHKLGVQL